MKTRRAASLTALAFLVATFAPWPDASAGISGSVSTREKPRTIVILGASYARAWGTPVLPGYERVINRGVGGEETGDMLQRFDRDVVAARPDAVLIWGHVNNITRAAPESIGATKEAAREHYQAMIAKARAANIEVILATEVPWTEPGGLINAARAWVGGMRGKQSYAVRISAHVGELNRYLRDVASRGGFRLLDFERVFADPGGTRKPAYAAEDGSHISAAGYAALSDYASRQLRQ